MYDEDYDIPNTYRNFYTDEIKNQNYSTLPEFEFSDNLNNYLRKFSLHCERVQSDQKQYSPYDAHVVEFNYNILDAGRIICKIEIEEKSHDIFDKFPLPPERWPYWSFLARKVDKTCLGDTDVYVLYKRDNYQNIFWASFVKIRANCFIIGKDRFNRYYRAPITKKFVSSRLVNLANYIITLKEVGKYSAQVASQKTLDGFE
jgi:hypothetical protein